MSGIDRENNQARARAVLSEQPTYLHQVIEYWPACTECGEPIRGWSWPRTCGCPDAVWLCTTGSWVRSAKPEATT